MYKLDTLYTFRDSGGYKWFAIIRKHHLSFLGKPFNKVYRIVMYPANKKAFNQNKSASYGFNKLSYIRKLLSKQSKNIQEVK